MGKFLETNNLKRLNPEEIKKKNLNRPVSSKRIKSIKNNFQKAKAQDQMVSLVRYTRHLRGKNDSPSKTLPEIENT